jgi:hypothetical protein
MMNEEDLQETLELFENKFAWLVYAAAAFLGNRPVTYIIRIIII